MDDQEMCPEEELVDLCGICHVKEADTHIDMEHPDEHRFMAHICAACRKELLLHFTTDNEAIAELADMLTCDVDPRAPAAFRAFCSFWQIAFDDYLPDHLSGAAVLEHLIGQPVKVKLEVSG